MRKSFIALTILALGITFSACRKKKEFKNEDGSTSQDNQEIQSQADEGSSDANKVIGNYSLLSGKLIGAPAQTYSTSICGATVDTNGLSAGTVLVNYDGVTVCNNRKKSGSMRLTIQNYSSGKRWKDAGCVLQVDYYNFKCTRASDGKNITFNGTHYVTNVSGGNFGMLIFNLQPNLVFTITGDNLNATFGSESSSATETAIWSINRKYTYTCSNFVFTCTGEGIGSHDGLSNLENWGTTRQGDAFTSQVITPVIWNTTCGAWAPQQGEVEIKVDDRDFKLKATFGVDNSGNATGVVANSCSYGWKVEWTHKNKTKKKIFGYL
jgi:hypothetical protein